MILLAFLLPLAMYLMVLGTINRRRHPLMVAGPWDFVGVLFAASGFLLFGGPGALSVLNDNWRESLVFGNNPSSSASATESLWQWWLFFMAAYFVLVVVGAGFFLWRSRNQTAIYNVDLETVQLALGRICERLGVRPLRSGDMYYFGLTSSEYTDGPPAKALDAQGVQTTTSPHVQTQRPAHLQNVILEVDAFRFLWHVTLRWEPAHSGLRQEVERELERELSETPAPDQTLGGWLILSAFGLLLLAFVLGVWVLLYRLVNHL